LYVEDRVIFGETRWWMEGVGGRLGFEEVDGNEISGTNRGEGIMRAEKPRECWRLCIVFMWDKEYILGELISNLSVLYCCFVLTRTLSR
jgi:hypothetical protein